MDNEFRRRFLLKREDYGLLYPYIVTETVTDINWNGRQLWIDDLEKGRYMASEVLPENFVNRFAAIVSNISNCAFNKSNPVLEAETEELRISVVHSFVAHSGVSISIRKTPAIRRMDNDDMVDSGYCSKEICYFLNNAIKAHCNIAICGLPGVGKTELLKYLTKFIPASERVIIIEDVPEIHYQKINPNKDCVEMKVCESFTYTAAIKASLRQLPKWIILSEARSMEVRYLLESLSAGTYGLTTLHSDDVRNIPDRMKNMAGEIEDLERIENDVYRFMDVGILLKAIPDSNGVQIRTIDQIGVFVREGCGYKEVKNKVIMLVENGQIIQRRLPDSLKRKFETIGNCNAWEDVDVSKA